MPEFATPSAAEDHAFDAEVSDQDIDTILDDFRNWLRHAAEPEDPRIPADDTIDLHTLVGHFTALRHEINLQTKAARGQQEQNAQAFEKLGQALEIAQQAQNRSRDLEQKGAEEQLRPLVKTLLDVYDVLSLARREVQRVQDEIAALDRPIPMVEIKIPYWARWLGFRQFIEYSLELHRQKQDEKLAAERDYMRGLFDSILTGYTMSLQRLERTLASLELEAIATVGETFDPERMEVIEVVSDSERANMEVVDEVRRGYLWRGRVFRFAQVRVAKQS